jgi:hypothetical protein
MFREVPMNIRIVHDRDWFIDPSARRVSGYSSGNSPSSGPSAS